MVDLKKLASLEARRKITKYFKEDTIIWGYLYRQFS